MSVKPNTASRLSVAIATYSTAVLVLGACQATALEPKPSLEAASTTPETVLVAQRDAAKQPDPREFKRWQDRWTRTLKDMAKTKPEKDLAYSLKHRLRRGAVVTLTNPLPTHQEHDVEVEWFFTYLSDSNNAGKITYIINAWNDVWLKSLRRHGIDNVLFIRTPVSHIDGLEGGLDKHHERHQEVVLAHGDMNDRPAQIVHRALLKHMADRNTAYLLSTRAEAEHFLKGLPLERDWYAAAVGTPELTARMRANNERLATVLEAAALANPNSTLSPHDPIFLINGKYVVLGSNTGSVRRAYQTANRLIAQELGDRWTYFQAKRAARTVKELESLKKDDVAYGTTRHARINRAIQIDPPLPTDPDDFTIELFYSYDSQLGRRGHGAVDRWSHSLPNGTTLVRSPVAIPRISNETVARRHQEIMMAGRPVAWEDTLQIALVRRLTHLTGSRRINTEADLDKFLAEIKMPRSDYDAGLNHPETQARLRDVNARYERIKQEAGDLATADPILLLNGRHLIVAHRFRTLKAAFHTANALIASELEAGR